MGLQEHTIDLLEIDGARSVSDGLEHGADAEVLCAVSAHAKLIQ
tara:strand:- start:2071 stop:2202 length:132 start_codon:yes stop_codon:yes gene_type:complete